MEYGVGRSSMREFLEGLGIVIAMVRGLDAEGEYARNTRHWE